MKRVATGLLVAAAAVYVTATLLEPRHAWLYYVARTSEAAMIGAIADWFAVVALFRHPLGLRFVPHTAILPRNKARIAQGLSQFIQENFLSPQAVVARIAAFRPAHALSAWLLKPDNAGVLARYASRFLAYGLGVLDDARARAFLLRNLEAGLRRADLAALGADVLSVLTEHKRHHELLDAALGALDDLVSREDTRRLIAEEVRRSAPRYLKALNDALHLRLDERAALRIVEIALRKLSEVRRDRDHELRRRFDAFVARFVADLRGSPALRERVERLRDELLESPAVADYVGGLWRQFRDWLAADVAEEPSATRTRLSALASGFGARLASDPAILQWIDEQILAAAPALVAEHRAAFGRFIEDQINGWQEARLVEELERNLGPDLQYIRINGTLVGGLVGLSLAILAQFLTRLPS